MLSPGFTTGDAPPVSLTPVGGVNIDSSTTLGVQAWLVGLTLALSDMVLVESFFFYFSWPINGRLKGL